MPVGADDLGDVVHGPGLGGEGPLVIEVALPLLHHGD